MATAVAPLQVPPLCLPDDVTARCVRALTPAELLRVNVLITEASMKIRTYTKRTFGSGQITQVLRASGRFLKIPQVPVVSVDAVALIDYLGNRYPVPAFGFDGIDQLDLSVYSSVLNLPEEVLSFGNTWANSIALTYTFGYTSIPPEVASKCAELVARVFNTPGAGIVGVTMEKVGPFESRLDMRDGVMGVMRLTQEDKDDLADYRRVGFTTELLQ